MTAHDHKAVTPLTAEKIEELERLLAALGTAEFQADHDEVVGADGDALLTCYSNAHHGYSGSGTAALIAEAINALPHLLSLAKRVAGVGDHCDVLLNRLEGWGKAYPIDIFSEPTDEEREWLHATKPGLMDRVSASMGRHMARMIQSDLSELRVALVEIVGGEEGK
jgi:hypothetical protein